MVPLREINTFTIAPILSTIAGSEPIFGTVHTPSKTCQLTSSPSAQSHKESSLPARPVPCFQAI
jgi:hypothetical protein